MPKGQMNGNSTGTLNGQQVHISNLPKPRKGVNRALTELVDLQRRLHQRGMREEATDKDIASCASAWQRLEMQRHVLLGKPLPGSLRPEKKERPKSKPASSYEEPAIVPKNVPLPEQSTVTQSAKP